MPALSYLSQWITVNEQSVRRLSQFPLSTQLMSEAIPGNKFELLFLFLFYLLLIQPDVAATMDLQKS